MNDDIDLSALSDEDLERVIRSGVIPTTGQPNEEGRIPAPRVAPEPPKANGEYTYEARKPVGSFGEGLGGQLRSYALGAGRLLGDVSAEKAQEHGAEMQAQRASPMGALGAGAGNVAVGVLSPFGPGTSLFGLARNALVGGGMEALSDYGEGKSGERAVTEGGARGAIGTTVANLGISAAAKLANAGLKKAGASGRWSSPGDELVYDFAKERGIDLRPGDVAGPGLTRAFENFRPLGYNSDSLQRQAEQIGKALFKDNTNQVLAGLGRAKEALDDQVKQLWSPVYQVAAQGTTKVKPSGLRTALDDISAKYPSMLNKIDNQELRTTLEQVMATPGSKLPGLSFMQVRELQQAIGPETAKLKLQALNGTITRDEANQFNRLYAALHGDLRRWGNHGSNQKAYRAYEQANAVYKQDYLPFYQNDVVVRWQKGDYDGHPELMISDLLSPAKRTQVDNLSWYGSAVDHDLTGWLETLRLADRATAQLAKGAPEANVGGGFWSFLSPKMALIKGAGHGVSGHPWATPVYGASAELGPRAIRRGLIGGLGLSQQEMLNKWQP